MRFVKILFGIVIAVGVVFVAGAYLMPREVTVERTVAIAAPADKIFPYLNSLSETRSWSPWMERDPDMEVTFEGPDAGVGNRMTWHSEVEGVGSGSQEIVVSAANERVETDLDFGDMGTARAWLALDEMGAVTEVTWGLKADMGMNPVGRWMGLMMDRWVGADYEKGLMNLKTLVEES